MELVLVAVIILAFYFKASRSANQDLIISSSLSSIVQHCRREKRKRTIWLIIYLGLIIFFLIISTDTGWLDRIIDRFLAGVFFILMIIQAINISRSVSVLRYYEGLTEEQFLQLQIQAQEEKDQDAKQEKANMEKFRRNYMIKKTIDRFFDN